MTLKKNKQSVISEEILQLLIFKNADMIETDQL